MSDLHKAMDSDIYRSVKTTIVETQDEFIWRTVYPFCQNELKASLSKEDLKLAMELLKRYKESPSTYDKVSERLDRINDLVQGKLSDQEMGELLRLEAEILHEVTFA